jgi:hypothetical protein
MRTHPGITRFVQTLSVRRIRRPPVCIGVGVGTIGPVDHRHPSSATVEVETVDGTRFRGRLTASTPETECAISQPGLVVAVRFDPGRPEDLALADDIVAARAAFDQMLIRKGLTTTDKLEVIRRGTRSHGLVTALRTTGKACEDHVEVEVDLMVSRTDGGQFPAHDTAFIPAVSVPHLRPGSTVHTYYRMDDESAVAICVPKR